MRTSVLVMVLLCVCAPLQAQSVTTEPAQPTAQLIDRCRQFDTPPSVVVTTRDGKSLRGTLMCLGDEVELATQGHVSRTPLSEVKRIAEPRDPIWTGAAVGAALGGLFWALCEGNCDNGYMLRATIDYALVGLALDASISNNKTIYKANLRSPALSFHFRF